MKQPFGPTICSKVPILLDQSVPLITVRSNVSLLFSFNFVCIKQSRILVLFGFESQKLDTLLENEVHLKSYFWKYVINKSWALLQRIKSQNDSVVFVLENDFKNQNSATFYPAFIFKTKKNQKPRIFWYTPSLFIPELSQAQPFIHSRSTPQYVLSNISLVVHSFSKHIHRRGAC